MTFGSYNLFLGVYEKKASEKAGPVVRRFGMLWVLGDSLGVRLTGSVASRPF